MKIREFRPEPATLLRRRRRMVFAPPVAYSLATTAGTFTETGRAANLLRGFTVIAAAGSFTETGRAANLLYPRTLTASAGTFTETGQAASLFITRTLAVTFPFATTAQSFTTSAGSANSVLSYDAAVGNPAGALRTVTTGSNRNDNNSWSRTLTYEAMGVEAGATVLAITGGSLDSRCTVFASGTGCTSGAATLVDGATTVTLSAQRAFSAVDGAYVNTTGTNLTGLSKASNNSVTLTIPNHLGTTSGGSGKSVTLYQDNLNFTIAYSPAFVPNAYSLTAASGTFTETGVAANFLVGHRLAAVAGTFAETGVTANLKVGHVLSTTTASFVETGNAIGLFKGRTLVAATGTFVETGIAATLKATRIVTAAVGSFTETGQVAGLFKGRTVVVAAGTFSETGQAASFLVGHRVITSAGTFTESGVAAGLRIARRLTAATGSFAESGIAAGLIYQPIGSFTIGAGVGAFTLAGQVAALKTAHKLTAVKGTFAETGIAAGLKAARTFAAAKGTFTESGVAAGLRTTRLLTAAAGSFTETGIAASLLQSHRLTTAAGSFAETGIAAGLFKGRTLIAAAGSFTETGFDASLTLLRSYELTTTAGSFVLTGQPGILISSAVKILATATGTFAETGVDAGFTIARAIVAATGVFRMPTSLLTSQVLATSLPTQTYPIYATDEDVAVRAGGDFIALAPSYQQMAFGTDGVFVAGSPWVLESASINFEDFGVSPNQVVHLTEPKTAFRGGGQILAVESVSGNAITLRRLHKPLHVGQPPAPAAGLTGVTFIINTLDPQIEEATFDIKRRFGIDEKVVLRGSSSVYDLRDLRMATVLQVMLNRYTQESRTEHGDFDRKVARIRDELADIEGRMSIRWGTFGDAQPPSNVFGTKLLRG